MGISTVKIRLKILAFAELQIPPLLPGICSADNIRYIEILCIAQD
ncbi:Uncharacterised protein [Legionella steigerwaltii]|uniref:Uncharacterized protein n=1 Tax=Legionella steigerwaltii TaxID=460 RepID=A0A378LCL8_9GAMM|nr:Uncharacterised protein [Legionella steigerwaltii]